MKRMRSSALSAAPNTDMRLDKIFDLFASLKLTVVILVLALILVFAGTLAQEPLGLYLTQDRFFKSMFVDAASMIAPTPLSVANHASLPLRARRLLLKSLGLPESML